MGGAKWTQIDANSFQVVCLVQFIVHGLYCVFNRQRFSILLILLSIYLKLSNLGFELGRKTFTLTICHLKGVASSNLALEASLLIFL